MVSGHGGAPRYDYPKEVWSPSGGWWAQPKTWKKNSLVIGLGTAVIIACTWNYSAKREYRPVKPYGWIPSMLWARQYNSPMENPFSSKP
ncbi:MAG: hypothetical protein DHS80DRAFT_28329 [Piptocephalis tieghemiana]|nr:MAG: hypothetical protein DHS80DRAFT_28329 [Piptocephalis tieghemiana]